MAQLHARVTALRARRTEAGDVAVPEELSGVSKERIRHVLGRLDHDRTDMVDAVFALLDDQTESWFSNVPADTKFCDGASTAHLACHIGILQRGTGKLDREGRDYWIKPLRTLGAIEPILLHQGEFIPGHAKAKSPNSAYRLTDSFKAILQAGDQDWAQMLDTWSREDAIRERLQFQAETAAAARHLVDTDHSDLIRAAIDHYAARFLPNFEVIYIDDGDGDRITDEQRAKLAAAGITLSLGDAMPDALLWNPQTNHLWVIEAVTSDGEVDHHKVQQLTALAGRSGKSGVGFTTAYRSWKEAAARQGVYGNVAVGSYVWIQADPARQFKVESFN